MLASDVDAFYLPASPGERFCLHHTPKHGKVWRSIVYVHPFAEEMNKSRRMAAEQARMLATHGTAVVQIDLHGCGDSSGDFGDASWQSWVDDVKLAAGWMKAAHGAPVGYWGLRAGCLLAAEAAQAMHTPTDRPDFLFWQPVTSGRLHLSQFLRLLSAAAWTGNATAPTVKEAQVVLSKGGSVDVAGYTLSSALAEGLSRASLAPPPQAGRGLWLELGVDDVKDPQAPMSPSPAVDDASKAWSSVHTHLHVGIVNGPHFWRSQEIEDAPALLEATLAHGFAQPVQELAHA